MIENKTYNSITEGYVNGNVEYYISSQYNRIISQIKINNRKENDVFVLVWPSKELMYIARYDDLISIAKLIHENDIANVISIFTTNTVLESKYFEQIAFLEENQLVAKFKKEHPREYGIMIKNCGFRILEKTKGYDNEYKLYLQQILDKKVVLFPTNEFEPENIILNKIKKELKNL